MYDIKVINNEVFSMSACLGSVTSYIHTGPSARLDAICRKSLHRTPEGEYFIVARTEEQGYQKRGVVSEYHPCTVESAYLWASDHFGTKFCEVEFGRSDD
ncbi:hypothetical protein LJC60_05625 [Ruminococcaceae bacterium OttesenSCG-928-D13]|nr:hypothetical protein [Ruminococcaceae bacterium OttesenSCG-928-D13]